MATLTGVKHALNALTNQENTNNNTEEQEQQEQQQNENVSCSPNKKLRTEASIINADTVHNNDCNTCSTTCDGKVQEQQTNEDTLDISKIKVPQDEVIIWNDNDPANIKEHSQNFEEMVAALKKRNIIYEQWEANVPLSKDAADTEIIQAYQKDVDRIMKEHSFVKTDVCQVLPNNPKKVELRNKFLSEHTHSEEEVRFFIDGGACFYIHCEEPLNEVVRILCTKGHLLIVPCGAKHWFDMGCHPFFSMYSFFWKRRWMGCQIYK